MTKVIVLQARTSSSRLPGKVLLPVAGLPLAVLAARRAANTGGSVIVAISDDSSDDVLAETLSQFNVPFYRGSLDRVLDRIVAATVDFSDDTVIIRLTADNVFPDGWLIDEVESEYRSRQLKYLRCNGLESGLPYGLSIEVTRLAYLREAAQNAESDTDQEHVTPYVIRKYGTTDFIRYRSLNKGHYRCTIDNLDDYISICRAFEGVKDPIGISSLELVEYLDKGFLAPRVSRPVSDMVVGTVQLGGAYGVANTHGIPSFAQADSILKTAISNGANFIDTARAYADSEKIIGRSLSSGWCSRARVITKLSPLTECADDASIGEVEARVDASIYQSCSALRVQALDVILLHRASHLTLWGGAVWKRLLELRSRGVIGVLGASVQNPDELLDVLQQKDIEFVQLPYNLLDHRWHSSIREIERVKRQRSLTVHARSCLLQGLLSSRVREHWMRAHVGNSDEIWEWLDSICSTADCESVADLCVRYVRSMSWVDGVVVGMESQDQLEGNIQSFNRPLLSNELLHLIDSTRPDVGSNTLDPAVWHKD